MAKYNVDITQNVEPSGPSPNRAAAVEAARGQVLTSVLGAAEGAYKTYTHIKMKDLEASAQQATLDFVRAQQEQAEMGAAAGAMIDKARAEAKQTTLFENSVNPMDPSSLEAIEQSRGKVSGFLYAADRFREAYENGGMSPTQYMARVQGLVKSSIAQFPGMANEIRKMVSQTTGLPFVDDESMAVKYVSDLFNPKEKKEGKDTLGEAAQKADLELITSKTGLSAEEVLTWRRTNDPRYNQALKRAQEARGYELVAEQTAQQRKALESQGGEAAIKSASMVLDQAGAVILSQMTNFLASNQDYLTSTAKLLSSPEGLANSGAVKAQLEILKSQGTSIVSKNLRDAKQNILNMKQRGSISATKAEELIKDIDAQGALWLENFDDKNLLTTATIMANHREKSLQEVFRMSESVTAFMTSFGNIELVKKYMGGTDADREEIRRINPRMASEIDASMGIIFSGQNRARELVSGGALPIIGAATSSAYSSPNAITVPVAGVANPKPTVQTAAAAVQSESKLVWDRIKKNVTTIEPRELNLMVSMLNTDMKYGMPNKWLAKDWTKVRDTFAALPDNLKSEAKASVAQQHALTGTEISNSLRNTPLVIGVRSDGSIGVVPVDVAIPEIAKAQRTGTPTPELRRKIDEYQAAKKEWENLYLIRANNMVLSRSIVTGEQPRSIGEEYARKFSNREGIVPFFSNEVQPVTTLEAQTEKLSSALATGKKLPAGQTLASTPQEMDKAFIWKRELELERAALKNATSEDTKRRIERNIRLIQEEMKRQGVSE